MARGMGHKRDLLRKMREPGFSPADLRNPSELLEKANKLKGFVQQQNSRTGRSTAKKEWMLAAQGLQDEREAAERELQAALQAAHEHADPDISGATSEALASWQSTVAECCALRQELREQIKGISTLHSSLKAYGVDTFRSEAEMVKEEASSLRTHLAEELQSLEAEHGRVTEEIQKQQQQQQHFTLYPPPSPLARQPSREEATPATQGDASLTPLRPLNSQASFVSSPAACQQGTSGRGGPASDGSQPEIAAGESAAGAHSAGSPCMSRAPSTLGATSSAAAESSDLESLLRAFPLVRAATKARVREVFGVLRSQHEEKMEEWRREAQMTAQGTNPLQAKASQWPEAEHSWFVSMRERYLREMAPRGASREALMKKLAMLMPKYSLAELMAHDEWHQKHKLLLRKRQGLLEAWRRERVQFFEDSIALLQEATQLAVERAETAADRLVHELTRERVNEHLEVLRAAAAQQAEAAAATKAEEDAKALREREATLEAFRAEQAAKKELVVAYKQKLQQQEAELAAAAAARAAAEEQLHAQQVPYHKARTEARQAEYKSKQESKKQALEAAAAEERARAARLDKLRELVAPHVESDPQRVLLPTEASLGVDEKDGKAFRDVNGYTVDQLYKDQRFKVMAALQSAGLHQTNYGRQVIAAMPTAKPTRPDNLHAHQRGEL